MHPVFQMLLQDICREVDIGWRVLAKKSSGVKSGVLYPVNNKMLGESRNSLFHRKGDILYDFCKRVFFYIM